MRRNNVNAGDNNDNEEMKRLKSKIQNNIFIISLKRGLSTPNLPEEIIILNSRLYVRVFRVIGMFSTVLILSNNYKELYVNYPLYLYVILVLLNFSYLVYSC